MLEWILIEPREEGNSISGTLSYRSLNLRPRPDACCGRCRDGRRILCEAIRIVGVDLLHPLKTQAA